MKPPVPILYEDNHVLVIEKPAGLLSQEDYTGDPDVLTVLKAFIKVRDQKPGHVWLGLVHRLDRPTPGLMVLAKTSKAASRLSEAIREHRMMKRYLVLFQGNLELPLSTTFEWKDVLQKDRDRNKSHIARSKQARGDEKEAMLKVTFLFWDNVSRQGVADVELITGRSHQIRVQFASRGLPLVGDAKYGTEQQRTDALGLYAYDLSFPHPTRDEVLSFRQVPSMAPWKAISASAGPIWVDRLNELDHHSKDQDCSQDR